MSEEDLFFKKNDATADHVSRSVFGESLYGLENRVLKE